MKKLRDYTIQELEVQLLLKIDELEENCDNRCLMKTLYMAYGAKDIEFIIYKIRNKIGSLDILNEKDLKVLNIYHEVVLACIDILSFNTLQAVSN